MAILDQVWLDIARELSSAEYGEKEAVYQRAEQLTGKTRATIARHIRRVTGGSGRKVRADKGKHQLELAELELISSYWFHNNRQTGKTLGKLEDVLQILRANGKIKAEFTDMNTGEVRPYSKNAVERALRNADLHPDQLRRPKPVVQLQSLHPNHVWQIDPSLCVLYYLKENGDGGNGLNVMEKERFYKNKPSNVKSIEPQRVWRYVITDHASGVIYVEYVYGGETAENISNTFINAIQRKKDEFPFCGVPKILTFDRGSANMSKMFMHLLYQLDVQMDIPTAGNARAKGQVEKGNDIVERQFESGLRFRNVQNLAELNAMAYQWMVKFNQTAIHSRHKMSRFKAWNTLIRPEHFIKPPSIEICRELLLSKLEERQVSDKLEIKFGGNRYDVRNVPNVKVGEKVMVGKNPYRPHCVQVECFEQYVDEDGKTELKPYWVVLEPVELNELGFRVDAAIIGQEYKSHAKTTFEQNLERVEQLAYGVTDEAALKKAKKSNAVLFNGEINPYKSNEEYLAISYLPKKGQEHELTTNARRVEQKPMSVVEFAKSGKACWGELWTAQCYQWVNGKYPQGVPQVEAERLLKLTFDAFKSEFLAPNKPALKLLAA